MAVRNFYIDADIDGHRTSLSGGPASRTGGLSLTILIRNEGSILRAVKVWADARADGTLTLTVAPTPEVTVSTDPDGSGGFTITTKR
jgi:hypothetical protein